MQVSVTHKAIVHQQWFPRSLAKQGSVGVGGAFPLGKETDNGFVRKNFGGNSVSGGTGQVGRGNVTSWTYIWDQNNELPVWMILAGSQLHFINLFEQAFIHHPSLCDVCRVCLSLEHGIMVEHNSGGGSYGAASSIMNFLVCSATGAVLSRITSGMGMSLSAFTYYNIFNITAKYWKAAF